MRFLLFREISEGRLYIKDIMYRGLSHRHLYMGVVLYREVSEGRLYINDRLHRGLSDGRLYTKDCLYRGLSQRRLYIRDRPYILMGWLRFVGSLKSYVSFAEYRLFYRALLQKRRLYIKDCLYMGVSRRRLCIRPRPYILIGWLRFVTIRLPARRLCIKDD